MSTYAERQEERHKRKLAKTIAKRNATRKRNQIKRKQERYAALRIKMKESGYK